MDSNKEDGGAGKEGQNSISTNAAVAGGDEANLPENEDNSSSSIFLPRGPTGRCNSEGGLSLVKPRGNSRMAKWAPKNIVQPWYFNERYKITPEQICQRRAFQPSKKEKRDYWNSRIPVMAATSPPFKYDHENYSKGEGVGNGDAGNFESGQQQRGTDQFGAGTSTSTSNSYSYSSVYGGGGQQHNNNGTGNGGRFGTSRGTSRGGYYSSKAYYGLKPMNVESEEGMTEGGMPSHT